MMQRNPGSFRDPCGAVYEDGPDILRTVNPLYAEEWKHLNSCGLLAAARKIGLIDFREIPASDWPKEITELSPIPSVVLACPRLPFITMPCEWSFGQLQSAALLTLDLHILALQHGCILKDASAYNVQFMAGKPVFIDLLSFERWQEGQPWQAYGQFCSHFLAPLALQAYRDPRLGILSRDWIDGIPLEIASALLPGNTRLSPGLAMHLHLHARMRKKHGDARQSADKVKTSRLNLPQLEDIALSLRKLVASLKLKTKISEWGDYYTDTNYTENGIKSKREIVQNFGERAAKNGGSSLAVDLGANTGEFSGLLAPWYTTVLATDYDVLAVERNWLGNRPNNMLPVVLDVSNPTPAFGWRCKERPSFQQRCDADLLMALALCHHLFFTFGIPFMEIAAGFSDLLNESGKLIVEFVPKEDSQVQRLLAARDDIFAEYDREHFLNAFAKVGFTLLDTAKVSDSSREIFLFEKDKKTNTFEF